ncbi:MAG: hypothetical protein KF898_00380 [Parachlamydiales bacterium]|nr:hypothetical protein [Verrucomicrobiota bacterium]MBX3718088.1 hypothetical protein [Candidatus Acheromyda pituitae]
MKKQMTMMLALCGLAGGVSAHAENTVQKPQVVTSSTPQKAYEATATKLTAEELAFASKLSDANRKAFTEKLTVEQRKLAIAAAKNASVANAADEAVAKILNANAIATAEKNEKASIASAEHSHSAPQATAQESHQAK